jgi:outer membrane protein assembly factor BamB
MKQSGLFTLTFIFIFIFVTCPAIAASDDWLMYQHDSAHTGFSSCTITIPLVESWSYPVSCGGIATAGSSVYFISINYTGDCQIYSVDSLTGQLIWSRASSTPADYYGAIPAVNNGLVYTPCDSFNATSGQLVLNYSTYSGYGSPTIAGDILLINTNYNHTFGPDGLIALNARTGAKMWEFTEGNETNTGFHLPGFVNHSPVIVNNVVYFACTSGVYAFNAQTGNQIWCLPIYGFGGYLASSDGNLYCASQEQFGGPNRLYCLDCSTGFLKWSSQTGIGPLAIANGVVYVYSNAVNASNGSIIWNNTRLDTSPVVSGGIVYSTYVMNNGQGGFFSWVHGIVAIEALKGDVIGAYNISTSDSQKAGSITISNNHLIVSDSGRVIVFVSQPESLPTTTNSTSQSSLDFLNPPGTIYLVILAVVMSVLVLAAIVFRCKTKIKKSS